MLDWSRRHALHALAAGATAALAGCGESGFPEDEPSAYEQRTPVTDYDALTVRDTDGDPLFWRGERPDDPERARGTAAYLTSTDDLSELTFAPGSEHASRLNAFARSTDFETQLVALQSSELRACYDLHLRGVAREPDGFHTSYCRDLRPADTACDAEEIHTVAIGVRLPFSGDDMSSRGSSWSRDCRGPHQPYPITPSNDSKTEVSEDD